MGTDQPQLQCGEPRDRLLFLNSYNEHRHIANSLEALRVGRCVRIEDTQKLSPLNQGDFSGVQFEKFRLALLVVFPFLGEDFGRHFAMPGGSLELALFSPGAVAPILAMLSLTTPHHTDPSSANKRI